MFAYINHKESVVHRHGHYKMVLLIRSQRGYVRDYIFKVSSTSNSEGSFPKLPDSINPPNFTNYVLYTTASTE